MANKIFKGLKFPGMDDYYVLPEAVAVKNENGIVEIQSYVSDNVEIENLDATLTRSGKAADAAAVGTRVAELETELDKKATKSFVTNKIAEAQLSGGNIDLSGYATKDELDAINFPVDSVNGKTGAVTLGASDVGAAPAATALQMLGDINSMDALPADEACLFRNLDSNWDGVLPLTYAAYARLRSSRHGNYTTWLGGNGANLYYTMTSDGNMPMADGWKRIAFANEVVKPADMAAALAQKAPAGFGYGETMTYLIESENLDAKLDEILESMADQTTKQIQIYDQGFSTVAYICTLWRFTWDYAVVDAVSYGGYRAIKRKYSSTWRPWEWENPPMALGAEYRTTARLNNKAMYKRMTSAGIVEYRLDGETTWKNYAELLGQTDYVVANGTSGVWSYWKFNSGLCIAMGQPTVTWGTQTQVITGQYRSGTALDLTGIFTAVMGGTCSNVHRYVNCFVIPSGSTSAELWATTAALASAELYSKTPMVVLFGKWK